MKMEACFLEDSSPEHKTHSFLSSITYDTAVPATNSEHYEQRTCALLRTRLYVLVVQQTVTEVFGDIVVTNQTNTIARKDT